MKKCEREREFEANKFNVIIILYNDFRLYKKCFQILFNFFVTQTWNMQLKKKTSNPFFLQVM